MPKSKETAMLDDVKPGSSGYLSSLQTALLGECTDIISPTDVARTKMLHLGCQSGSTTTQLAEYFQNVREILGIDKDQESVDYAFNNIADEVMDFAAADIEDQATFELNWASRFDWIFSTHSLLFVKDHAAALRNLMWFLRPGGKCFIAMPAAKPADFHSAVKKVIAVDGFRKQYQQTLSDVISDLTESNCNRLWFHHPHADRVYSALLEQVGYQVLKTKTFDFKYTFASADEYKECLKFLLRDILKNIPEAKQASFFKDFSKAATKKVKKGSKGTIVWNIKYVIVLAKRPEL